MGGSGAIYCPADYSDDGTVGFRRSELLTDGKNNADSVEESDDEKILTDDAYGFSRQSPTIATTAPPSRHSRMTWAF